MLILEGKVGRRTESQYHANQILVSIDVLGDHGSCNSFSVLVDKGHELDLPLGARVQMAVQPMPMVTSVISSVRRLIPGLSNQ